MEDIASKRKPAKTNQKVPMSNIKPNIETSVALEKSAESKKTKATPPAASREADLGKVILPSKNLARHQEITHTASPTTRSKPFEVSTGMEVKGKKKIGNNVINKNNDQNAILSKMFERIGIIIH